jgi:hypothetical protein
MWRGGIVAVDGMEAQPLAVSAFAAAVIMSDSGGAAGADSSLLFAGSTNS